MTGFNMKCNTGLKWVEWIVLFYYSELILFAADSLNKNYRTRNQVHIFLKTLRNFYLKMFWKIINNTYRYYKCSIRQKSGQSSCGTSWEKHLSNVCSNLTITIRKAPMHVFLCFYRYFEQVLTYINPMLLLYIPLKTSKHFCFSDVYRRNKKGTLAWNGLAHFSPMLPSIPPENVRKPVFGGYRSGTVV